jgi:hypothetical protein
MIRGLNLPRTPRATSACRGTKKKKEGKRSGMFTEREHSGLQNGNMFNMKLIAVATINRSVKVEGKGV